MRTVAVELVIGGISVCTGSFGLKVVGDQLQNVAVLLINTVCSKHRKLGEEKCVFRDRRGDLRRHQWIIIPAVTQGFVVSLLRLDAI